MNGHRNLVMKKSAGTRRPRRATRPRHGETALAAAEFKATCLHLMDRVRESGVEYVVTKHGEPVAKLVPYHCRRNSGSAMRSKLPACARPS
jgi:prevent-host-death family protein